MPHLYLLRHAKSSWDDPTLADRDRPLANRGREATARLARYAERTGVRPQLALCSPARRTRETLDAMRGALGKRMQILYEEQLYMADVQELIDRLRSVPADVEAVIVVGHNPGMEHLLLRLGGHEAEREIGTKFPTGALATLEVDGPWERLEHARLVDYVVPRNLT